MLKSKFYVVTILGLALMFSVSGCKLWPKKTTKTGAGAEGLPPVGTSAPGGISGTDAASSAAMAERPEGGLQMVESQFTPVYFDFDSSQIKPSDRGNLDVVAERLKKESGLGVIVEGNCDQRGSAEYNMALGERRALAARAYFINAGIEAERIQTKSYGKEQPADPGTSEAAWAKNRRDEFKLFKK